MWAGTGEEAALVVFLPLSERNQQSLPTSELQPEFKTQGAG